MRSGREYLRPSGKSCDIVRESSWDSLEADDLCRIDVMESGKFKSSWLYIFDTVQCPNDFRNTKIIS